MGVAPLAIAGMAMAAGGAGMNARQQRQQRKAAESIGDEARRAAERNRLSAEQHWRESLAKMAPEEQEAALEQKAAERMAGYEAETADVAETANIIPSAEGTPKVVKNEAAKRLGDELARAKEQMAANANLGGWSDLLSQNAMMLGRSGENVGQLANFTRGYTAAADRDYASTASYRPAFTLGDAMTAAGSVMSMGAGGAGAAAGSAGAAGAGTAGTAGGLGSILPDWWTQPLFSPRKVPIIGTPPTAPSPRGTQLAGVFRA